MQWEALNFFWTRNLLLRKDMGPEEGKVLQNGNEQHLEEVKQKTNNVVHFDQLCSTQKLVLTLDKNKKG